MKLEDRAMRKSDQVKKYEFWGLMLLHEHMRSMDQSLLELYKQNKITKETALKFASNADMLKRKL